MEFKALPKMSFAEALKTCLTKKYFCLSGRARRSEYWWFSVLTAILGCLMSTLVQWKLTQRAEIEKQIYDAVFDSEKMAALQAQAESVDSTFLPCVIILGILYLALILPSWGVAVRRLHDIGKSGWMLLIGIIPIVNFIGAFVLLYWSLKDSDKQANKYGESPKYIAIEE